MTMLAAARVYFRIGVPFETVWIDRIRAANPHMLVADVAEGTKRRSIDRVGDDRGGNTIGVQDPHVWLSAPLAKRMAARIRDVLTNLDPSRKNEYERNYADLTVELDTLDTEIRARISPLKQKALMTFHPAWGYGS